MSIINSYLTKIWDRSKILRMFIDTFYIIQWLYEVKIKRLASLQSG